MPLVHRKLVSLELSSLSFLTAVYEAWLPRVRPGTSPCHLVPAFRGGDPNEPAYREYQIVALSHG